jgi:hypothetical protein
VVVPATVTRHTARSELNSEFTAQTTQEFSRQTHDCHVANPQHLDLGQVGLVALGQFELASSKKEIRNFVCLATGIHAADGTVGKDLPRPGELLRIDAPGGSGTR